MYQFFSAPRKNHIIPPPTCPTPPGVLVGVFVGVSVGVPVGANVGVSVGVSVGVLVGVGVWVTVGGIGGISLSGVNVGVGE